MDSTACQDQNSETVVRTGASTNGEDDRRTDFQKLKQTPKLSQSG